MFDALNAPRSPSFNEVDTSNKPEWLANKQALGAGEVDELDRMYRRQAEMLLAVDEALVALVDTLRARGELDSTYIMFTSDHGLHFGEHRLVSTKLTPYRASARVPLAIAGPGIPAGQRVAELTLLSDVAPTMTDLAEVPTPGFVDGRSLTPWLSPNASKAAGREQVLLEFWPRDGFPVDEREEPEYISTSVPEYRALRSADYLYTEYRYSDGSQERELYDLGRDPFELQNIVGRADAFLLSSLSSKLDELQHCRAQTCRAAENRPLERHEP